MDIHNSVGIKLLTSIRINKLAGEFDLNEGWLSVENLEQRNAVVNINKGYLEVLGNYNVLRDSKVIMQHKYDYIYVGKDLVINSNIDSTGLLTSQWFKMGC